MERKNVLVVEDEFLLRDFIVNSFRMHGWTVEGAENGKKALEFLKINSYDVVLSDLRMPELDGLALLNSLRLAGNDIPFVLLSGAEDLKAIKEALRLGAFDFVEKPVSQEELLKVMTQAIELSLRLQKMEKLVSSSQTAANRLSFEITKNSVTQTRVKNNLRRRVA
jgi:two-component system C4-dicarboxylate transport response regulator DctD